MIDTVSTYFSVHQYKSEKSVQLYESCELIIINVVMIIGVCTALFLEHCLMNWKVTLIGVLIVDVNSLLVS